MSNRKREKRRAKKLAKHRKKRSSASRAGGDVGAVQERTDGREGRTWPVGECFLSENWHEQGAHVHAVVSRAQGERAVAAFFEVDLAERGVIECRAMGGLRPDHVRGECGVISEKTGVSLVEVQPAMVAQVVHEGRKWGESNGHSQPRNLGPALDLLRGIDPEDAPFGVDVGRAESDAPAADSAAGGGEGWLSGLKRRILG